MQVVIKKVEYSQLLNANGIAIAGFARCGKSRLAENVIRELGRDSWLVIGGFAKDPSNRSNYLYVPDERELANIMSGGSKTIVVEEHIGDWFFRSGHALNLLNKAHIDNNLILVMFQNARDITRNLEGGFDVWFIAPPFSRSDRKSIYERYFGWFEKFEGFEKVCRSLGSGIFLVSGRLLNGVFWDASRNYENPVRTSELDCKEPIRDAVTLQQLALSLREAALALKKTCELLEAYIEKH